MLDSPTFLLVEDDSNDVLLVKRAFLKARILNPLQIVTNGEDAIAYLSGIGKYVSRVEFPLPNIVLLDISMPGVDGFQVLTWIRQQVFLSGLRVVMLSSADAIRDVNRAYQLGASSFLIKPIDFERFVEISQALGGSWTWSNPPRSTSPEIKQTESDTRFFRKIEPALGHSGLPAPSARWKEPGAKPGSDGA
jgi:CheY-like chemotaxis protein